MADTRGRKARATNDVYDEPNPELGSALQAAEAAANPRNINKKPATHKATGTPNPPDEKE